MSCTEQDSLKGDAKTPSEAVSTHSAENRLCLLDAGLTQEVFKAREALLPTLMAHKVRQGPQLLLKKEVPVGPYMQLR